MSGRSPADLDAIVAAVARAPGGTSVEELQDQLQRPRRTLQRHLTRLVAAHRLEREGRGPATRYRMPEIIGTGVLRAPPASITARGEVYVPLGPEARSLRHAVRAPLQQRRPVGYQRSFLDAYQPNVTAYLPDETRAHLRHVGRSTDEVRPAGTYARLVFDRLLIDLSWNSSRLEGNTYSLLDTERLLALGEEAEGKSARDAQMILNHKAAIEFLVDSAEDLGFNRYTILNLHALLSHNLLADPAAHGRLRKRPVAIHGTVYHPLEVPQLIEESFQQMLDTAAAIADPFEQAFFVMVHLPYLQPFEDVNKRTSRLAANIPMVRENLCPLSFVDVPEQAYVDGMLAVYELNRMELLRDVFVWAYERSSARYAALRQSLGEPDPFRLRHRASIAECVSQIVRQGLDPHAASQIAQRYAATQLPSEDRSRFTEVVDTELSGLHEGNIARYKVRPSEYRVWRDKQA